MHGIIAMPRYFNIVLGLFDQIHHYLNQYVFEGYHHVALALRAPIALCITLYIVLLGYSVSQGWVAISVKHIIKLTVKLSVVYTLAMNWNFFSHYIVNFIQQGSSELGATLFQSNQHFSSVNTQQGIEGVLQSVLTHFTKIGYWLWRRGAWHSVGPYFEAIIVWTSGLSLVLYAVLQLLIANIMLSILFVLAPLFVSFMVFESTQLLFDRWAGHVISYALLTVFVSVLLSLALSIAQWSISDINEHNLLTTLNIASFVPIVLVCFISVAMIRRVSSIAHDIGLNFSTSSIKRVLYEAVRR